MRFGNHVTAEAVGNATGATNRSELGLASDSITVIPRFYHLDYKVDDFGPNVPPEVQTLLAECFIKMTLVHYDDFILRLCMNESMGGGGFPMTTLDGSLGKDGTLAGAGTPLGGGKARLSNGNHFIGLNLVTIAGELNWRFPTAYLAEPPVTIPLGTEKSLVILNWRAIPYVPLLIQASESDATFASQELKSKGAVLWDHTVDT